MNKLIGRVLDFFLTTQERKAKYSPFTKDIFFNEKYQIGAYTYGVPEILHWGENANLIIGKFCSIADNVKIFLGGNHRMDWVTTYPFSAFPEYFPKAKSITGHPSTKGDVVIGNDVWLGHSCTILSGVTIGNGAIVGAGAVVTKNIGDYEIWAGNPAVFIKKRFLDDIIDELLIEKWWDLPIEEIMENINVFCESPKLKNNNIEMFKR
jgi:acetyltransferase-like isoleucine patch superfamily enzyme